MIFKRDIKKILLINDEENISMVVPDILKNEGYAITYANDECDALTKIIKNHFDIVILYCKSLTQVSMAHLNKIMEIQPKAKVLVVFMYENSVFKAQVQKIGVTGVLDRPYDISLLINEINRALLKV